MFFQQWLFSRHLNENEKILFVEHKHWIEIIEDYSKLFFLGIVFPWIIYLFSGASFFMIFATLLTCIVLFRFSYVFFDWYFDAILITNESLLFINWHGFFHQESNRVSFESVESINIETQGFLSTILRIGDVRIEREAAPEIEMKNMNKPKKVESDIMEGKRQYEKKHTMENTDALHDVLSELVANHIKKNGWKKKNKLQVLVIRFINDFLYCLECG